MKIKTLAGVVLAGFGVAACGDAPTAVDGTRSTEGAQLEAHSGASAAMADGSSLLTDVPVTFDGRKGTVSITRMESNPAADSDLLVDGILEFEEDGVQVTEVFSDVPADLSRGSSSTSGGMALAQRAPNETGKCDILFLDVGPIFLDLLGLQVDLSQIVLDVDAQQGSGNLLGNLLCTVTGLLDDGVDAALDNVLDQVNNILGSATGLLNDIPVTGDLLDQGTLVDGVFEGTLSLADLALNQSGELVGSVTLNGTVNQDGTLTAISNQSFENVTLGLSETLGGGLAGIAAQRGANEQGTCDILFLEVGPIFLDVLGLTVDLSQIELDVDAQGGSGNLLGNLLCELTGLLDDGLVDAAEGLLARVNNLLG